MAKCNMDEIGECLNLEELAKEPDSIVRDIYVFITAAEYCLFVGTISLVEYNVRLRDYLLDLVRFHILTPLQVANVWRIAARESGVGTELFLPIAEKTEKKD